MLQAIENGIRVQWGRNSFGNPCADVQVVVESAYDFLSDDGNRRCRGDATWKYAGSISPDLRGEELISAARAAAEQYRRRAGVGYIWVSGPEEMAEYDRKIRRHFPNAEVVFEVGDCRYEIVPESAESNYDLQSILEGDPA